MNLSLRCSFLILLLISQPVWSGGDICESAQSGNWEDPSTWSGCSGGIPINDTFITIKDTHVVTLNDDTAILNEFVMEVGSEIIIADVVGGITMISENDPFDTQFGTITLNGDLTILGDHVDVLLGNVDGAAGLTINSDLETRLEGTIGVNTALTSLTTDALGTLVFANTDGGVNTPNYIINGPREFNDPITLATTTHINGPGPVTFNDSINGFQELILTNIANSTITFNADVGAMVALNDFRIFNSSNALAAMNMNLFNTNGRQQWDSDMLINAPSQLLVLANSNTNDDIRVANGNWVRGISAGTQSLQVNSARNTMILGVVGDNAQPLKDLNLTAQTDIILNTNSITATENMIFNTPVVLADDIELISPVINTVNTLNLDTFDLTINSSNVTFFNADVTGSGDLIKTGVGLMGNDTVTTMTGNLFINGGFALNNSPSDNPFPEVPVITLSDIGSMGDGASGDFVLADGQTLTGLGACLCHLNTSSNSVIAPGFNYGVLTVKDIELNDGSTLEIEINGTNAELNHDQLLVETANLDGDLQNGAILDVVLNFVPNIGDQFNIVNVIIETPVSGTFAGLPEGAVMVFGDYFASISYVGGTGNDVVLTVIGDARYHVDENAVDTGSNDGLSWDTAFSTLQDALDVALGNTEIWVAAGTYYPDEGMTQIDNSEMSSFHLKPNVSIYGGFIGDETDISARDPYTNTTILSGDIDGNDINTDGNDIAESTTDIAGSNAYHVINGEAVDINTIIDGFTITAGNAVVNNENTGAGMFCGGAGIGPAINQVMFIGNFSSNRGSASLGCTDHVTNSQYINNRAGDLAGAVRSFGGYMEHVVFEGNFANIQAGALLNSTNTLTLNNATFIGNANGQGFGGAIRSDHEMVIESSLFSGNRGAQGGAINMVGSQDLTLTNVTMTGNRATALGGAIYSGGTGALIVINSVIWNNQDSSGLGTTDASILYLNPNLSNSYSLIQGYGTSGTGNLDEDPLFDTEIDPITAPTTAGNARPTLGSPILNVGDNLAVTATTDLDGETRIEDVTVDLGAYEGHTDLIFKDGFE